MLAELNMKRFTMHQMAVLVFILMLMRVISTVKSFDFCFDASLEGSRLNSPIFKETSVSTKMECILLCVEEQCCRSINYMEKLPQSHHSVCEMLHDVAYTSSELEKNRSYDYVYFTNPQKEYNISCITNKEDTEDFDLNFPSTSVDGYILLDNNVPEMNSMTILFWINTLESHEMAVLSYAVEENVGELRLLVKRDKIIIQLQSLHAFEFPVPPINDGFWHHVGITWSTHAVRSQGHYSIYLDGVLIYSGDSRGSKLKANGVFAVGQKLLSTNGTFDIENSFSGKLSQLNVWDYDVMSQDNVSMSITSCFNDAGNIINWSALQDRASEAVVKEQRSSCMSLRNDSEYDVILAAKRDVPEDSYTIKATENVPSVQAFSIAFWAKSSIRSINYSVDHAGGNYSNDTENALTLEFWSAMCVLLIKDIKLYSRFPRYKHENPAYWHHIATTWSSDTGHWKIYLDGSLVSVVHDSASGITIPAGGPLYIVLKKSGQTSRLNIWDYEVDGHALSIMANKGPLFENGNVFAWYGVKSKIVGDVVFQKTPSDLFNSRSRSVYQMDFPEASVQNYAKIDKPFSYVIKEFSVCFWAKILKLDCAFFAYSTPEYAVEFQGYLNYNRRLDLNIKKNYSYEGPSIGAHDSWHFYCMQWRSSDGLTEYYQDARKLRREIKAYSIGIHFPPHGDMILGQELDAYVDGFDPTQAFKGSLAGLNFWNHFLDRDSIQGMSAGVINVNGNLLQWRDLWWSTIGNVHIVDRSEPEIPEYRVQALRDQWCEKNTAPATYARFIRNQNSGYQWRCAKPSAMLPENMCYDLSVQSTAYYTRNGQLLRIK